MGQFQHNAFKNLGYRLKKKDEEWLSKLPDTFTTLDAAICINTTKEYVTKIINGLLESGLIIKIKPMVYRKVKPNEI